MELEECKYERLLYTDASVDTLSDPPGKAAVGYIWFEMTQAKGTKRCEEISRGSAYIGASHSSYSAEAIAIRLGLEGEPAAKEAPRGTVGLFTDSLSNLSTVHGGLATTAEQEELLRTLDESRRDITVYHVKAHHTITRNNQVDELCSIAATPTNRVNREDLGGSKTKATIKSWTKDYLARRRMSAAAKPELNSATCAWIGEHVTVRANAMHLRPAFYNELPRRHGVLLAKARTYRWTNCNWFLHKIEAITCEHCSLKNTWTDTCITCESCTLCGVKDDTGHLLDRCSLHEQARTRLLQGKGYARNVSDLLTSDNPQTIKDLAGFLATVDDTRIALQAAVTAERAAERARSESRANAC